MKKKPELFKRTGKSSLTLRNFLNNLKENDLHYENKQITQCVFLGVLRLKPVPSIFSKNNVPSVSAPAEHKSKRIKNNNSNKEQNKNVSRKSDINKVLSGKVSKKNPQKVKAAVKKVPDKKSTIKIKLHTKKKTSKVKKTVHSSPTDKQETVTVSSESSQTVICDPVLVSPTISLNPIVSPTKFNPVQNLFDKLKQKIDSCYGEPGPSTVTKQTKTVDRPSEENSKVCKINAKRQVNPSANANKKSKKVMHRKPANYERLTMPLKPTSPITISDSDSTSKKDDIFIIDGNVEEIDVDKTGTEDIIFVNDDPKPVKQKERTSPRNRSQEKETVSGNFEKNGVIIINEEQKSMKSKRQSPPKSSESSQKLTEAQQKSGEVIVISETDEPKTKAVKSVTNKKAKSNIVENAQDGSKNDVIIIDELKVSPRLKNVEVSHEKSSKEVPSTTNFEEQVAAVDEVIVINEEANGIPKISKTQTARDKIQNLPKKPSADKSKTQELNITIDDQQNDKNKDKPSPRLLKIVDNDKSQSVDVKKELIELYNESEVIVISEKPKQRKMKLKSPLIPPMFLNAPMLLRSELAPKKTMPVANYDKPKVGKRRERTTSKLLRPDLEHTKNVKYSMLKLNEKNSSTAEVGNSSISKSPNKKNYADYVSILSSPQTSSGSEEVIFVADHAPTKKPSEKSLTRTLKPDRPARSRNDVQEMNLITEVESCSSDSLCGSDLVEKEQQEPSYSIGNDDIIVVNEEPIEERRLTSMRHLRSEFAQHKSPDNPKETTEHIVEPVQNSLQSKPEICKQRDEDVVKYEVKPNENFAPRLLRSDLTKQKVPETDNKQLEQGGVVEEKIPETDNKPTDKIEEKVSLKEELPGFLGTDQTITEIMPQEKSSNIYNEEEISAPQENPNDTELSSDKLNNIHDKKFVAELDEEIMIVKEEPKPKGKVSQRTLRSDIAEPIKIESLPESSEEVLIIDDANISDKEKTSPRLLRLEQKVRTKSPQKNKKIDLDEIIVVNEKRPKKTKERTVSGRLLRSELALQKSRETVAIKTEVEEVVVLIHAEPKSKQKGLAKCEGSQKHNRKINIQEEVIVLADDTQPNKKTSPRSLRSDAGQKHGPEKTPTKTKASTEEAKAGKRLSLLRSLRSEPNPQDVPKEECKAAAEKVEKQQTRSEITSKISPQTVTKNYQESYEVAEMQKQTSSSRSLRSVAAQPNPENVPIEKSTSPEIIPRKSPRAKDQPGVVEDKQMKLPTSPRLLRSQHSPRNMPEESENPVEKQKLVKPETSKKSDMAEDPAEKMSSSRSLRSVSSKSLSEQSESPVKAKVQKQRLLRSENATSISNNASIDQSITCDLTEDRTIKSEPDSPRLLRSDIVSKESSVTPRKVESEIGILKSPPRKLFGTSDVIEDTDIDKQTSRLLRSEMSSLLQQSESTEGADDPNPENMFRSDVARSPSRKKADEPGLVCAKKKGKSPSRKTKYLLMDSKTKLKTPMLLRSELAQLKNPDADCPNQKREPKKKQKKKGRRSKSAPSLSNLEVSELEPTPSVQTSKLKAPKRKSLIDDLKRKQLPKQKTSIMKNLKKSPEVVPEPQQTSEELSNISENGVETVSPSTVDVDVKIEEKPTQDPSKLSNKTQGASKCTKPNRKGHSLKSNSNNEDSSVTPITNVETPQENTTERPLKRRTKAQAAPKSVSPKMNIEDIPQEKPALKSNTVDTPKSVEPKTKVEDNSSETPLKRKSDFQDTPKSVKTKLSKNATTPTKSKSAVAESSPKDVDPLAGEKSSPRQKRKRLSATRKLKVAKSDESGSPPKIPVPEEAKVNKTPETTSKQVDTTVFDFDETEPEVVPLRLNSPRKDKSIKLAPENAKELRPSRSNVDATPKPKKLKLTSKTNTDDSRTKAHAKAKLLAMLGDKSPQTNNTEPPEKPKGKSTKTKSASKTKAENDKSLDVPFSSPQPVENTKKDKNPVSDKANTSPSKTTTSPMKQTTITDMFSKALVKKEKANLAEAVFGPSSKTEDPLKKNTTTDMAPPKVAPAKNEEEENGLYDDDEDDDSDCESRVEWIPEEYAEYKFKYSAKKMMSYKPIHKCKICLLILPSYYKLKRHKKEHAKKPNPYNCTQCDQAFPSIEDLTAHLRIHKGKHPYTCKKCDIGFWSKKLLDDHTPIHVLRKVKQSNKRFRCDVCAKEFGKLCDMERHTRVHTGEKPCVCNICNKRFQQSHNLSKHLLTHLHVKPYHCEICNKQFGRNDVLNRHLLTHSVDKPIKCPLCPKGFIRQTQLKNHMKKNHPDAAKIDAMSETNVEAN